MARTRFGRRDWDSVRRPNKVFRVGDVDYQVGDCVLIRPSGNNSTPYVALVDEIDADNLNNLKFHVRRYYRPEEAGGRKQFHGRKELFLSDHFEIQSAHTIEGKCTVHTFKNYTKLQKVGQHDYYCRFEYKPDIGVFTPDRVEVYCKCAMPSNPDDLMIQCEECWDWYHPRCLNMTKEQAINLEQFICSGHSSDEDMNNKLVLHVDEAKKACEEITDHLAELDEISKGIFAENEKSKIDLSDAKRQLAFVKSDPRGENSELLDIIRGMEAEVKTLEKKRENILRRILQKRKMVRRRAVIDFMRSPVYEQLLNRQVETGFKRALSQLKHMKIIPREFHHDVMNVYKGDDLEYSEGQGDDLAPDDLSGHEFGEMLDMNLDDDEQLKEEGDDDVNDLIGGSDGGAGNGDGSNNLVGQNF